eukprot:TRINITY_DN1205_c0_g1_i1.p1 TRINITY_DN1205_c0_g1~~TRINITY_DN1205_c0_g1_i1.p1  ORF type:complete len:290 (-),score=38.61 TRINITY_DN1205_c0_g1_i1:560-1429(-)
MCHNQTLNELVKRRKRLTELEVRCYLIQTLEGLKYLHSHKIIHRDLKLGNLFLTERMEEKIGDFGLATRLEFEGDKRRTICGTPNYIAPEVLDSKQGHSYEADIWSLGVVLYILLVGKPPFEMPDLKSTYRRIRANDYAFPEKVYISAEARSLIAKIFNPDPSKRPKIEEILAHPFLSQFKHTPKFMPVSTLACPPSESYVKQFLSNHLDISPSNNVESYPLKKHNDFILEENKLNNGEKVRPLIKEAPSVWVKEWFDYTAKYGLCKPLCSHRLHSHQQRNWSILQCFH